MIAWQRKGLLFRGHYIYGLTFDLRGEEHPWTELYTPEERERFARALD